MRQIASDPNLVAYCGLYCGACRAYLNEKCPSCHVNAKATWCKVRTCCIAGQRSSCAECKDNSDPMACSKYNNFMSKIFGFIFRSDRAACIRQIKEIGITGHAENMASSKRQTIKK